MQDASFESSEQLHQQDHSSIFGMLNPNNPDGDIDHRTFPLPPLNQPPPGYFAPYPQESQLGPVNIEEQQSSIFFNMVCMKSKYFSDGDAIQKFFWWFPKFQRTQ